MRRRDNWKTPFPKISQRLRVKFLGQNKRLVFTLIQKFR